MRQRGGYILEKKLKFHEDGTFVIVQFSDIEFIDADSIVSG